VAKQTISWPYQSGGIVALPPLLPVAGEGAAGGAVGGRPGSARKALALAANATEPL